MYVACVATYISACATAACTRTHKTSKTRIVCISMISHGPHRQADMRCTPSRRLRGTGLHEKELNKLAHSAHMHRVLHRVRDLED